MIRFDRNEFAGAFGDIGTDLPLIAGMLLATDLHAASVLTIFGALQILAALTYRMPMAVQPLKAVAAIVIVQQTSSSVILGGGLAIGLVMFIFTITGCIQLFGKIIPKPVIRGIQFGLGLKLAFLALGKYVPADGSSGYFIAAIAFVISLIFLNNRKYPAALIIIPLGLIYAFTVHLEPGIFKNSFGLEFPVFALPTRTGIIDGFLLLALAQIPLSLGNSIYATKQVADDLFPEKNVTLKKIGLSYSIMNLIAPFFSGIPVCHGSGGLAGHYTFGGRTGGSVIIYGSFYLILGVFFSRGFSDVIKFFPLPILGIILLFEAITLICFIKDIVPGTFAFTVAVLVGVIAASMPYGFMIGMVSGSLILFLHRRVGYK